MSYPNFAAAHFGNKQFNSYDCTASMNIDNIILLFQEKAA